MKPRFRDLACLIGACCCPLGAAGEVVTFDFIGGVSSVYNPFGVVNSDLIKAGDPVQVSLRFDTTTPDTDPASDWGRFSSPGWLKVNINGLAFERTTTVQIDILHGANGGEEVFQVLTLGDVSSWPALIPTYSDQTMLLQFWETGPPYDFLSNADLPTHLDFSPADVKLGTVRTSTASDNMYEVQFGLIQVPEPGAGTLLIGGLLLSGILSRQTRK